MLCKTMTALFELKSETLSDDELKELSGCAQVKGQIEWLRQQGWQFLETKAGKPVVGRMYARLKLAGITLGSEFLGAAFPNFDGLNVNSGGKK